MKDKRNVLIRFGAAILAATTLVFDGMGAAQAAAGGGQLRAPSDQEALEFDIRAYAESVGLSPDELLRTAGQQETFSRLVEDARVSAPDGFVAAAWKVSAESLGWIAVQEPSAKVDKLIEQSGLPVTVRIVDAPTEVERDAATAAAYYEIESTENITSASAWSDPETGNITVAYEGDFAGTPQQLIEVAAREAGRTVAVRLVQSAVPVSADEYSGGMAYGGSLSCTGGFVVRSGSTYGISTAAHCGLASTYHGGSFVTQSVLSAADGDLRWNRSTSGAPAASFQYNWGSYRTPSSAVNPAVGTSVCHFGQATGYGCSTVYGTGYCGASGCGLCATAAYITSGGDSGGPWFSGNGARGIHSGVAYIDFANRSMFTRIGAINLLSAVVYY